MKIVVKIACLILALASIWFSISIKGKKAYFKCGTFERPLLLSETSEGSDSTETEFA